MIEAKRLCGWRKIGGMYLCGEYISMPCDRLPLLLTTCPVCGQGIKVSRGFTQINPYRLWGIHPDCRDRLRPCFLCDPQDQAAYIMLVGGKYYTPENFLDEACRMGISKRIPFIPHDLELGKTIIFLAHPKAVEAKQPVALQQALGIVEQSVTNQPRLLETEKVERALGVFCAFIPKRVEKLIKELEATPETIEALKKRSITAIPVPDDDPDHND